MTSIFDRPSDAAPRSNRGRSTSPGRTARTPTTSPGRAAPRFRTESELERVFGPEPDPDATAPPHVDPLWSQPGPPSAAEITEPNPRPTFGDLNAVGAADPPSVPPPSPPRLGVRRPLQGGAALPNAMPTAPAAATTLRSPAPADSPQPRRQRPTAVLLSDRPPLAAEVRGLLIELGFAVTVLPGPEQPWHHAADRTEDLVLVDVPGVPAPEGAGLDLSRCIAVRPPGASPAFDAHAVHLGLRAVVGRQHAVEELKSVLGDPDATALETSETVRSLSDEEIDAALGEPRPDEPLSVSVDAGRHVDERFLLLERLAPPPQERWRGFDERRLVDVEIELRVAPSLPSHTERFLEASRRAQRLQHPNIVGLVAAGQWNGFLYTATEWVSGQSLRERMDAVAGPLPLAAAARIGRQIASALDLAHRRGLAHRGLEPDRIRVLPGDSVHLTDLAGLRAPDAMLTSTRDLLRLTRAGYLAPERFVGAGGRGFAADAWALGVLLYEMAAGFPPFQAAGLEGMREAVQAASPPPLTTANPAVPEGLAQVVTALLDPDPARRPSDLRAIAERLFAVEANGQRLAWTPSAEA